MRLAPFVLMVSALGILACDLHATIEPKDAQISVQDTSATESSPADKPVDKPEQSTQTDKPKPPHHPHSNDKPTQDKPQSEPPAVDEPTEPEDEPEISDDPVNDDDCILGLDWFVLPVRVHRLSSNISNLNGTLTDDELVEYMAHVNTLWAQACIRFEIESIVETMALPDGESNYESALDSPVPGGVAQALATVVASEDLLEWGWNVVIINHFGIGAAGVYIKNVDTVYFAQGKYPTKPTHPTILAHELGHALGLPHYSGPGVEVNMMHTGGSGDPEESIELTEDQINISREQAATGDSL